MSEYIYKTENPEARSAALAALFTLGYYWDSGVESDGRVTSVAIVNEAWPWKDWPTLMVRSDEAGISAYRARAHPLAKSQSLSFDALLKLRAPKETVIAGVGQDGHRATIKAGTDLVMVGCQSVSISKIKEIVAAWDELNPPSKKRAPSVAAIKRLRRRQRAAKQ